MYEKTKHKHPLIGSRRVDRRRIWLLLDEAADPGHVQREVLCQISQELMEMTEQLLVEMEVSHENSRSLMAEFGGIFETAAELVSILIDFDETFESSPSRLLPSALLAKQLERALVYLCGVLSAANSSDALTCIDWVNLKSDVDSVWKTCRSICRGDISKA